MREQNSSYKGKEKADRQMRNRRDRKWRGREKRGGVAFI